MNGYRVPHNLLSDPALAAVAKRARLNRSAMLGLWLALLDRASQNKPRGLLPRIDAEELAAMLEIETAQVETALSALREKQRITDGDTIANWKKTQYCNASAAARTRKWRARKNDLAETEADVDARRTRLQRQMNERRGTPPSPHTGASP